VVEEEQIPLLDRAAVSVNTVLDCLALALPVSNITTACSKPLAWSQENGSILVKTAHYSIELDKAFGGAIVNLQSQSTKVSLLTGISNDLVSYRDSGGLWRMGYEFAGGIWRESGRASDHLAQMQVREHDGDLEVVGCVELDGETFLRKMWLSNDSPIIYCRVEGKAAEGHSVTLRFSTSISAKNLVMDTPGGLVVRPLKRIYDPTFWPLHQFVYIRDENVGRGLAIFQRMPGAISCQPDGQLELVAVRNAIREKLFGLIGIPANPASGHERETCVLEYALLFTENGDWRENDIHLLARDITSPWGNSRDIALRSRADSIITTDSPAVWVTAIKPASRGEGGVVRLHTPCLLGSSVVVTIPRHLKVMRAFQASCCRYGTCVL